MRAYVDKEMDQVIWNRDGHLYNTSDYNLYLLSFSVLHIENLNKGNKRNFVLRSNIHLTSTHDYNLKEEKTIIMNIPLEM